MEKANESLGEGKYVHQIPEARVQCGLPAWPEVGRAEAGEIEEAVRRIDVNVQRELSDPPYHANPVSNRATLLVCHTESLFNESDDLAQTTSWNRS